MRFNFNLVFLIFKFLGDIWLFLIIVFFEGGKERILGIRLKNNKIIGYGKLIVVKFFIYWDSK